MPLDLDLQELRRAAASEPESGTAWLALAHGLSRAGAAGDAVESYFRARALGADAKPCTVGLASLGARPSPWTHDAGDSQRSFSAPVRGPRRGEIVAREGGPSRKRPPVVVVDADGSLVVAHENQVERLGRWLARLPLPPATLAPEGMRVVPAVSDAGVVCLAAGPGRTRLFFEREPGRGLELPGLPWEQGSPAVAGPRIVLGWFQVPDMKFLVDVFDGALARVGGVELPCRRWGAWAASEQGIAIVVDEWIRGLGLDGSVRFSRPAASWIDGLALSGERTVWSELRQSSRDVSTRWVQALDAKGDYVWGKNVEGHEAPGRLAVSPDGTVHVASRDGLVRFASDGKELPRGPRTLPGTGLVADREGVAFVEVEGEGEARGRLGLAAIAPDGARLWFVPETLHPVALDGLGRLLALTDENALVAVE